MVKERLFWMLGGAIITVVVFVLAQQFVFGTSSAENISKSEAEEIVLNRFSGEINEIEESVQHYSVTVKTDSHAYKVMVDKQNGNLFDYEQIEEENETTEEDLSNNSNQVDEPSNNDSEETDQSSEEIEEEENQDEQNDQDETEEMTQLTEKEIMNHIQSAYSGKFSTPEFIEAESPYFQIEVENELEIISLKIDAFTGEIINEDIKTKDKQTPISKEEAIEKATDVINGELEDIELKDVNGTYYYYIEIELPTDQEVTIRINAIDGSTTTIWEQNNDGSEKSDD